MERLGRVSRRSGITRYHQLYTYLRRALVDGAISPGSALPSESELMRQYHVSRNTVRRALATLEEERLIIRRRGSGTYARSIRGKGATSADEIAVLTGDPKKIEADTTVRFVRFDFVDTPDHVLRSHPQFGPRSLLIYRTRSHAGECFAVQTSYVREKAAKGLTRTLLGNGIVSLALARLGHPPIDGKQTISAVPADAIISRHLAVPDGSPVLRVEGLTCGSNSVPIEYYVHVFRPDRYQVQMPIRFERSASGESFDVTARQSILPG